MRKWMLGAGALLLMVVAVAYAQTTYPRSEIYDFVNGIRVNTVYNRARAVMVTFGASGVQTMMPATQTIAAGGTVAADACGGYKRISSAGAVATSTTNTFTAPDSTQVGACSMTVCNVGANNITLDNNVNFKSIAGADIVLTADDCTMVVSDGTVWRSTGPLVAN